MEWRCVCKPVVGSTHWAAAEHVRLSSAGRVRHARARVGRRCGGGQTVCAARARRWRPSSPRVGGLGERCSSAASAGTAGRRRLLPHDRASLGARCSGGCGGAGTTRRQRPRASRPCRGRLGREVQRRRRHGPAADHACAAAGLGARCSGGGGAGTTRLRRPRASRPRRGRLGREGQWRRRRGNAAPPPAPLPSRPYRDGLGREVRRRRAAGTGRRRQGAAGHGRAGLGTRCSGGGGAGTTRQRQRSSSRSSSRWRS